jgi:hypothetical protein
MENGHLVHSVNSSTLGDLLERILDKGVVISGDIRVKLVSVELLTIQIRLVICSVDRATEIGLDWWRTEQHFFGQGVEPAKVAPPEALAVLAELEGRLGRIEHSLEQIRSEHG